MTSSYAQHFNPRQTPQTEKADPRQVSNSAGGFAFAVDKWKRLERFLILGSDAPSYYASAKALTRENALAVQECLAEDGPRAVKIIADISDAGRAPKNDPAVFALALAASHPNPAARAAALAALPRVCRIGTHLFQFVEAVDKFRGWGRGLQRGVGAWYLSKTPEQLAFQVTKYARRGGWSHRDVLRLAHPEPSAELDALFRYVVTGKGGGGDRVVANKAGRVREYGDPGQLPALIAAVEEAKHADEKRLIELIAAHNLPREVVPTERLQSKAVWEALVQKMPIGATIRSLGKMTAIGLLAPMSEATRLVARRLQDVEQIKRGRVHPVSMLEAATVYKQGRGDKGSLVWTLTREIVDALDAGFYEAFKTVEPSGARTLLAFDVSGSMDTKFVAGIPGLAARVAAATMGMVTARVEPNWHAVAFTSGGWKTNGKSRWGSQAPACITDLTVSPRQRLDDLCETMRRLPMGGTDCALPMLYAAERKIPVDTFVLYTDDETWAGDIHPHQALRLYRDKMGIPAKLAVVSFVANEFSIADQNDAGMLDLIGFDTDAPAVLADFSRVAQAKGAA